MPIFESQRSFEGGETAHGNLTALQPNQSAFLYNWQVGPAGQLVKRRGYRLLYGDFRDSSHNTVAIDGLHYYTDGTSRYLLVAYAGGISRYNLTTSELESTALYSSFTKDSEGNYPAVHFLDFYNRVIIGNDNTADAPLKYDGSTITAVTSPNANYNIFSSNYGFLHGVATEDSSYRYRVDVANNSGLGYVTTPWADYYEITQSTVEKIVGISPYSTGMLIFSRDNIYTLTGASVGQFAEGEPWYGVGCQSHESIQTLGELGVVFVASDGIYLYLNGIPIDISGGIKRLFSDIEPSRLSKTWAKVAPVGDQRMLHYLCGVTTLERNADVDNDGLNARNDTILLLNKKLGWMHWGDIPCDVVAGGYDSNGDTLLFAGNRDGQIFQLDTGLTDNGEPIYSKYVSRAFYGEGSDQGLRYDKILNNVFIHYRCSGTSKIRVKIVVNSDTVIDKGFHTLSGDDQTPSYYQEFILDEDSHYLSKETVRELEVGGINLVGQWFQIIIEHDDPIDLEILAIILEMEAAGI